MPQFCPQCGHKLEFSDAKFCPDCGRSLTPIESETIETELKEVSKSNEVQKIPKFNIHEAGRKLEQNIELLFQSQGYQTERNKRIRGKSGTLNEIDIIAIRDRDRVAIECKNYSNLVGIEKIRDFLFKLEDLENEWRGVFIAYSDFTEDAEQLAESERVEMWGHDEITEKIAAFYVGRYSVKGEKIELDPALELNIDYEKASVLYLHNKEKVTIQKASLFFHPYYKIHFHLRDQVQDPNRKMHIIDNKGIIVVDALSGKVLNKELIIEEGIDGLIQSIKQIASQKERKRNRRLNVLFKEIKEHNSRNYSITVTENYIVNKLQPEIILREAQNLAVDYIISRGTREISYVKRRRDYDETMYMKYIPKKSSINIIRKEILLVPRWEIYFSSLGTIFTRELLGCSGTILEDTMAYCPRHVKLGMLSQRKKTIAVCESCGRAFCEDHIDMCPTCQKWLCEEHGVKCSSCGIQFCTTDIQKICQICGIPTCHNCLNACPICGKEYGSNHTNVCEKCGAKVCPECTVSKGILLKTKYCKKCIST